MNKDINNHQSDFDVDEIWAAIEPQVDEINARRKKRKPIFLYWLSGVGLLVGIIAASFFLFSDNTSDRKKSNTNLPNEIIQTKAPVQVIGENQTIELKKDEKGFNKIEKEVVSSPTQSTTLSMSKVAEVNKIELNTDIVEKKPELILPSQTSLPPTASIIEGCLLYTSPSPRDLSTSRMPSSA